ncbi:MAG TPA: hypothetical protein VN905_13450 [Candidatus Binatia bacterium]|nr:hypothetical protein [Candidatus Binatia bacterium]
MQLRILALLWVALSCSSCGWFHHSASSEPAPNATATPIPALIARRGEEHPLAEALDGIGFKPFIPQHVTIVTAAVLPAFSGEDLRKNRGLGVEYESSGRLFALSQWPSNGGGVEGAKPAGSEAGCEISSFRRDGFLWATATRVATLQPDGNVPPSAVLRETRRIIREGACRELR